MPGKSDRVRFFNNKPWNKESIVSLRYHKPHVDVATSPTIYALHNVQNVSCTLYAPH